MFGVGLSIGRETKNEQILAVPKPKAEAVHSGPPGRDGCVFPNPPNLLASVRRCQ